MARGRGLAAVACVTPAMLDRLRTDRSVANPELSALLRRNLLVPVMHGVTFEELDQVSPTLASRGGFSTAEESMEDIVVATKPRLGEDSYGARRVLDSRCAYAALLARGA